MTMKTFLCVFLLLATGAACAETKRYELDPVHTRIAFACKHLRFSYALGSFAHPSGTLWFDEKDWSSARVEATIDITSLDLGDEEWKQRMLKRDFFHVEKFAQAHFVSSAVEKVDARHMKVTGELTLRGASAPVVLDVTLNEVDRHPYTFKNTAGFSARTVLKRSEFGMISLPNVVADEVELRIEVEATRAKGDD
jgi:polyisoprenoid-binding protein YceI